MLTWKKLRSRSYPRDLLLVLFLGGEVIIPARDFGSLFVLWRVFAKKKKKKKRRVGIVNIKELVVVTAFSLWKISEMKEIIYSLWSYFGQERNGCFIYLSQTKTMPHDWGWHRTLLIYNWSTWNSCITLGVHELKTKVKCNEFIFTWGTGLTKTRDRQIQLILKICPNICF